MVTNLQGESRFTVAGIDVIGRILAAKNPRKSQL
jgi:hypothetical protein